MVIKNGQSYANNYARAASYFLGTCAPMPKDEKQQAAYQQIRKIYETIAEDAAALGYKPVPDVTFSAWESQKGREKDVKFIRDAIAKVEKVAESFFNLVEASEVCEKGLQLSEHADVPQRTFRKVLEAAGMTLEKGDQVILTMSKECAEGLKELAGISREHIIPITDGPKEDKAYLYFSRCVFEPDQEWTAEAFDRMLVADGELIKLGRELEKRGFRRVDCRDGKKISLDYIKQHGKKEEPLKSAWAERTYSGIEVSYEELRLEPCFIWIRMPMFKKVLEHSGEMVPEVAEFIKKYTKTCDGCRYCVQTDKTGQRPLAALDIDGQKKCPYYPGFTMNFRMLTPELVEKILSTLDTVNKILDES
ncbi:MAG: hypothetical protein E7256_06305 [Lachnospiraceae bacterium]|nr:hypothetical protein [Lachnospiraceae bacterium]